MPFHPPNRRTSRKPRTPEPGGEAAGGPRQDADDDEPAEAPDDAAAGRERDEAALRLQEAMRRKQCALYFGLALPSLHNGRELDEAACGCGSACAGVSAAHESLCCTVPLCLQQTLFANGRARAVSGLILS